jgi:hypothetical protein
VDKETYMPSVRHAVELVGGYDALAKRVGVTSDEIVGWAQGTRTPSIRDLLFVLDVVMVETRKIVSAAMAFGLAELTLAKAASSAKSSARPAL